MVVRSIPCPSTRARLTVVPDRSFRFPIVGIALSKHGSRVTVIFLTFSVLAQGGGGAPPPPPRVAFSTSVVERTLQVLLKTPCEAQRRQWMPWGQKQHFVSRGTRAQLSFTKMHFPTVRGRTMWTMGAPLHCTRIVRYFLDQVPPEEPPCTTLPNALASPLLEEQVPL